MHMYLSAEIKKKYNLPESLFLKPKPANEYKFHKERN